MSQESKRKFVGVDQCLMPYEQRPPFIYVGVYDRDTGENLLALYVDRDLKGAYWPDESGRMVKQPGMGIDLDVPRCTLYRRLTDRI